MYYVEINKNSYLMMKFHLSSHYLRLFTSLQTRGVAEPSRVRITRVTSEPTVNPLARHEVTGKIENLHPCEKTCKYNVNYQKDTLNSNYPCTEFGKYFTNHVNSLTETCKYPAKSCKFWRRKNGNHVNIMSILKRRLARPSKFHVK